MNIPYDIVRVVFSDLPITDKRNLTRTCREHQTLIDMLRLAVEDFHDQIRKTGYAGLKKVSLSQLCKFTIELLFDGYAHLIPKRYIIEGNEVFYGQYGLIYFNSARRGKWTIVELLIGCKSDFSMAIRMDAQPEVI